MVRVDNIFKMLPNKKIYILLIFAFILSSITSLILVNKYDRYEVSTDSIENHAMIKGDIPDIWIDGQTIKNDLDNGKNYFDSGKEIFRSYLPPRLIVLYSYIFKYELFEDWENKIFNVDKSKVFYLIFQSLFYYICLLFFYKKIINHYPIKTCFFIILFLALEPTIFFYHSSFHTESIFFTMEVIMLTLLFDNIEKKIKSIAIGILLGLMFMQKLVAIYYIIPITIYYLFKLKIRAVKHIALIFLFYSSIIFFVGYGNYKRADLFYFMPPSSKITLHLYFPSIIISNAENIKISKATKLVENDKKKWIESNKINLNLEKDRIVYYDYLQKYSIGVLLKYPLTSIKFITWRTIQTGILNPAYILEFFKYENGTKKKYYLEEKYKKFNLPMRMFYSLILFGIIIFGFFTSKKQIKIEHYILLTLSSLYMLGLLGWANNSRYFAPILIYLSIFFGHGATNLLEKVKIKT